MFIFALLFFCREWQQYLCCLCWRLLSIVGSSPPKKSILRDLTCTIIDLLGATFHLRYYPYLLQNVFGTVHSANKTWSQSQTFCFYTLRVTKPLAIAVLKRANIHLLMHQGRGERPSSDTSISSTISRSASKNKKLS